MQSAADRWPRFFMKKLILIFFLFFGFQNSFAQLFELGGEVGFGKTTFDDYLYFSDLFGKYSDNQFNIGIIGSFNPNHSVLFFNTGLFYQRKEDYESSLNYFKIPLGLNIEPGKKFRVIFGGGFYLGCLFMTAGSVDPDLASSKNDFQIGSYADVGFKYHLVNSWNIFVKMQLDIDLTTLYKKTVPTHFGGNEYQNIRSFDYSINLGFNYLIPLRKEQNE
jgi:hypothetical protein